MFLSRTEGHPQRSRELDRFGGSDAERRRRRSFLHRGESTVRAVDDVGQLRMQDIYSRSSVCSRSVH